MANQLKTGIVLNYINMVLCGLVPLLYTPIMLSLLGQQEYGLYKLSSSISSYLSLTSIGLGAAMTRFLIKARVESGQEEEEKTFGLFIRIFNIIAIVTVVIGTVLSLNIWRWYSDSLNAEQLSTVQLLVIIMSCNTAVSFLTSPYISIVNSHERFIFLQTLNILSTLLIPILNLIALYAGYASVGLSVISLITGIILRITYHIYVKRHMHLRPKHVKHQSGFIKEILSFSFWIFISMIVSQLYSATDIALIGAVPALAATGVAIYSVGETFNSIIFTLNAGVTSLLNPKANKLVFSNATPEEITCKVIQLGRLQCFLISLFAFGFITFGKPFIHFYIGDEYADSYWVAIICIIPNIIPLIQSFCLNILIAKNKNKFRALVYLGIAIMNAVGTYLLIRVWGIIGAACMTGISLFIGQGLIMNWYYHKKLHIDMIRFWKETGIIILPTIVLSALFLTLSRLLNMYNLPTLICCIVSFLLIYIFFNWKFLMNTSEKELIISFFNGIINHRKTT